MAQRDSIQPIEVPQTVAREMILQPVIDRSVARRRRDGIRTTFGWTVWFGLALVVAFIFIALAAPLLAPYDPTKLHPAQVLAGPSRQFLLGTDNLGRDILSRLLYGSRLSLGTAALAAALIMTIGVTLGAVSGYFRGFVDTLVMRIVDVLLAFPSLVVALAIAGVLGPSVMHAMLGLVCVWWVGYARVVRGLVLSVRERPYVEAARTIGANNARVLWRHIMPNVVPPVIVLATLEIGQLLLAIAGLNFLGLGAQPPTPEWGAMLNEGRPFLQIAPQLMIYPGLAISLVVLGFNLLGDGLRDALDPRLRV
jgi:ABC-type dipeptide/oligopeptide/nickel transport system permease subunit